MADVDQLRVALVVAAGQNIRQRVGGIQRGQAGNPQLDAAMVQVDEVPDIAGLRGAGENHIVDAAVFQQQVDLLWFRVNGIMNPAPAHQQRRGGMFCILHH